MSKLYISEYSRLKIVEGMGTGQLPDEDSFITDQVVDFSGGVASSNALNTSTVIVRLATDAICSLAYGASPTATTSNQRWASGQSEYRGVTGGKKYSAVTNT